MTYQPEKNSSISHGILRTQDLLRSFASELERFDVDNSVLVDRARADADIIDANDDGHSTENANDTLESLFNELDALAPDGCYFGAHPGDGSDFGYWEIEE